MKIRFGFVFLILFSLLLSNCKRNGEFSPKQLAKKQNVHERAKHTYSFWNTNQDSTFADATAILAGYPKDTKSGESFVVIKGKLNIKVEDQPVESLKIQLSVQIESETTQVSILKSSMNSDGVADSLAFVHSGLAQPFKLRCQGASCEVVHLCFPNRFRDQVYCSTSYRFKKNSEDKYGLSSVRNAIGSSQVFNADNMANALPDALLLDDCPETDHQCHSYVK